MILQVPISAEIEERLVGEAERRGVAADQLALRILDEQLPPKIDDRSMIEILQSWIDEDDEDADPEYDLLQSLDRARPSARKLFPEELKGISW